MPLLGRNKSEASFNGDLSILFKFDYDEIYFLFLSFDEEQELDLSLVKSAFASGARYRHRIVDQIGGCQRSRTA